MHQFFIPRAHAIFKQSIGYKRFIDLFPRINTYFTCIERKQILREVFVRFINLLFAVLDVTRMMCSNSLSRCWSYLSTGFKSFVSRVFYSIENFKRGFNYFLITRIIGFQKKKKNWVYENRRNNLMLKRFATDSFRGKLRPLFKSKSFKGR